MTASDEGFLGRWSRRKLAVRRKAEEAELPAAELAPGPGAAEAPAPVQAQDGAAAAPADGKPEDGKEEIPLPELPDIETLHRGSDFKAFMQPGVPPALRKQALRRLWRVNPVISHIDGLDDYCEDYTDAAMARPNLKTAYKIGRGIFERVTAADDAMPAKEPEGEAPAAIEGDDANVTREPLEVAGDATSVLDGVEAPADQPEVTEREPGKGGSLA